jgi:hypothetical protein
MSYLQATSVRLGGIVLKGIVPNNLSTAYTKVLCNLVLLLFRAFSHIS